MLQPSSGSMAPPDSSHLWLQIVWLLVLAVPVGCVAWTVTHEEVFREPREYCAERAQGARSALARKFFYLFTCEYCFSHWVTAAMLALTRYHLVFGDWRGYVIGGFALVWIANVYMSLFGRLRLEIREERLEIDELESDKAERTNPHVAGWRR
jgi:hypothetical protein